MLLDNCRTECGCGCCHHRRFMSPNLAGLSHLSWFVPVGDNDIIYSVLFLGIQGPPCGILQENISHGGSLRPFIQCLDTYRVRCTLFSKSHIRRHARLRWRTSTQHFTLYNALHQERAAVMEIHIVQQNSCATKTALDVTRNNTITAADENDFQDICGFQPVAWGQDIEYQAHSFNDKKKKNGQYVTPPPPDPCCCPCGSRQNLAEDDLLTLYKRFLFQKGLPCDFVSLNELDKPDEFGQDRLAFPRVLLTEFTGRIHP